MPKKALFFLFACLICFTGVFAEGQKVIHGPVTVELTAEDLKVERGAPFWVAVQMEMEENWHAYWKNPGGTGFPPRIEWDLPEGVAVEEVQWPLPEKVETPEGSAYFYHGHASLLVKLVQEDPDLLTGSVPVRATLKWLVCSDANCRPGEAGIETAVVVIDGPSEKDPGRIEEFARARKSIPKKIAPHRCTVEGNTIAIDLDSELIDGAEEVDFYPENPTLEVAEIESEKGVLSLSCLEPKEGELVNGIVVVKRGGENLAYELEVPIIGNGTEVALLDDPDMAVKEDAPLFEGGVAWALLLAFAGGLILNLMPCVLPVISLKIFSFVKMAGENRAAIIKHGVLFTFGVLVSFWTLALMLIILQGYGHVVGWGFQLQEPLFVGILTALIFVFSLSLFGVFEFGTMFASWAGQKETEAKKESEGAFSAFMSGVLATAVATPCTGPFLGPAIGFAMTLPAYSSLLVFSSLALGMASPYLLVSLFPSFLRYLPKPGPWMVTFKEILGFCMLATSLWLLWVFGAQTGMIALFGLLAGLFVLSVGSWIYGKWGTPLQKPAVRYISYGLTAAAAIAGMGLVVKASEADPLPPSELVAVNDDHLSYEEKIRRWVPYSKEKLNALQEQGTPVLVDFTARWCLICQANHMVLSTRQVSDRLAELGVVKMEADWTKNDPAITEALKEFGRSGVPLYLLYEPKGGKKPFVLPQVLTPDIVMDYLDKIEDQL